MHWWTKFKASFRDAHLADLIEKRDYYQKCIDNIERKTK